MKNFIHNITKNMVKISRLLVNFGMGTPKPTMSTWKALITWYDLVDVALHQNLFRASQEGENF